MVLVSISGRTAAEDRGWHAVACGTGHGSSFIEGVEGLSAK